MARGSRFRLTSDELPGSAPAVETERMYFQLPPHREGQAAEQARADCGSLGRNWCVAGERVWVYAAAWLLPLTVTAWYLPPFADLLAKQDEKGQLPELVHWIFAFVRFNRACDYLPTALVFVGALVVAETPLRTRRCARRVRSVGRAWLVTVTFLSLLAWALPLVALLWLLAYEMRSVAA